MLVCIGDLHIKSKLDKVFEEHRITKLLEHLEDSWMGKDMSLALLGDIFDSNTPSLEDIQLFYSFTARLSKVFKDILVICGNHDFKVFNFLPEVHHIHINEITYYMETTLVPWTHLEALNSKLSLSKTKGKILLTHARCTIEPFIKEETNIGLLADRFTLVVLGDIHMPYSPYPNVYYTSEPTQHSYKTYSKNTTGYIVVHKDATIERVFTDLPRRVKLPECHVDDLEKIVPTLDPNNRYRIPVSDIISNLKKLKGMHHKHILYEKIPTTLLNDNTTSKEVKELVDGKISIQEMLFKYVTENYTFLPETSSKIQRLL